MASPKNRSGKPGKRSTPVKAAASQTPEPNPKSISRATAVSAAKSGTPRARRRASDFASKKRSGRKRPRDIAEDTDDVDKILHDLRGAVESDAGGVSGLVTGGLLSALQSARDAFEKDESGSSSSEETGKGIEKQQTKRKAAKERTKHTKGETKELSNGLPRTPVKASNATPRKGFQSSPKTPRADMVDLNGTRTDIVAPARTTGKSAQKVKSMGKKNGPKSDEGKKSALRVKGASAHKRDIEALKQDDPEFYKFLEENEATLLEFDCIDDFDDATGAGDNDGDVVDDRGDIDDEGEGGDGSEDSDSVTDGEGEEVEQQNRHVDSEIEEAKSEESDLEDASKVDSKGIVEDVGGYSDDDDGEEQAEADAAAEAGIDLRGVESDEGEEEAEAEVEEEVPGESEDHEAKKRKKVIFVDMPYLRDIKEQLKSTRSSLKATKELLRLFRAGKDILPGQTASHDKKAKMNKKRSRKDDGDHIRERDVDDMEDDEFADDGSFASGKVRFASAKAYQHAMNLAITGIQDALDRMLGKPAAKKSSVDRQASKWDPTDSGRWLNLQPVFRSYVFHMLSLCDTVVDPKTSRFLLKRLELLVPYTRGNKSLLKKMIKIAVRMWSADALHVSEATRLRAYLLLNKIAHGPGNAEVVLRSCCTVYASSIANVCNPRTLPRIHFATTCIVELFGVDMGASYTTAFANLREMAVSLRAVLVSKEEKEEVERIHNWSYINRLRLWSKVLGKYGSEDELRPLIYPYVQVSLGVMRVHATPRTFPMRLHVASYLSELVEQTGVFIPLAPHLLSLLRCSELRKKPGHGNSKALEWRSILRVSSDIIKTKPFLTGVLEGVILHLAKYFSTFSRHVSFPEIAHVAEVTLRKLAKEVVVGDWKLKVMALVQKLRQTSEMVTEARAKADFTPQGAVCSDGMLGCVPGIDREKKMPIQLFYEVEFARSQKEERLRDEKVILKQEAKPDASDLSEEESSSDSEPEPVPKRLKKSKPGTRSQPAKKDRPSLSIVDLDDDEQDIVEDLNLDDDSAEE